MVRGEGGLVGYRGAAMASPTVQELNEAVTGYDRLYGLRFVAFGDAEVRAEVEVRDEIKQPLGLVHGGLYASLAESMTSLATAAAVMEQELFATGMSNNTSFLRPITAGTVHAHAIRLHRGRTTWVWDVTFTDDAGRMCAVTRMTIAIRLARETAQGQPGQAPVS
jgi:1,4-dihydroxy-2-naphthoyl-CoA hydrolase